jgi:hypothetical protein
MTGGVGIHRFQWDSGGIVPSLIISFLACWQAARILLPPSGESCALAHCKECASIGQYAESLRRSFLYTLDLRRHIQAPTESRIAVDFKKNGCFRNARVEKVQPLIVPVRSAAPAR